MGQKKKKVAKTLIIYPILRKIPKSDIGGKMLRPKFKQRKFAVKRLPKIVLGSLGKRPGTFKIFKTFGTLATSPTSQTSLASHFIYICRYFANKQFFFLAVNAFIHWIFNVMFNPVHHHCHPFTDFYKKIICVEFRPLLTVRKSDTFIFWRACLLVVPAGLDQRTYSIGTLQPEGFFWLSIFYLFWTFV